MFIKNKTVLDLDLKDKNYQFVCDPSSTYGEVYDALSIMRSAILQKLEELEPKKEECCQEKCSNSCEA